MLKFILCTNTAMERWLEREAAELALRLCVLQTVSASSDCLVNYEIN